MKAVLKGKLIALIALVKESERFYSNNLTAQLNTLGKKQKQNKNKNTQEKQKARNTQIHCQNQLNRNKDNKIKSCFLRTTR
jgi:hypothetical protein